MIINKPKKGDILVYLDEVKQQAINPNELKVNVGRVTESEDKNGNKIKLISGGTDKEINIVLSELNDGISDLKSENLQLRKTNKIILEVLSMLIQQANVNLNQQQLLLLKNKEEK